MTGKLKKRAVTALAKVRPLALAATIATGGVAVTLTTPVAAEAAQTMRHISFLGKGSGVDTCARGVFSILCDDDDDEEDDNFVGFASDTTVPVPGPRGRRGPAGPTGAAGPSKCVDSTVQGNSKFVVLVSNNQVLGQEVVVTPNVQPGPVRAVGAFAGISVDCVSATTQGNNIHITVRTTDGRVLETACRANPPGTFPTVCTTPPTVLATGPLLRSAPTGQGSAPTRQGSTPASLESAPAQRGSAPTESAARD